MDKCFSRNFHLKGRTVYLPKDKYELYRILALNDIAPKFYMMKPSKRLRIVFMEYYPQTVREYIQSSNEEFSEMNIRLSGKIVELINKLRKLGINHTEINMDTLVYDPRTDQVRLVKPMKLERVNRQINDSSSFSSGNSLRSIDSMISIDLASSISRSYY